MTYKNPSVTIYDPRIIPLDPPGRRPAWLRAVDDYEPVKLLGANKLPVIDPDTSKGALGWYAAGAPWSLAHFIQVETGHPYLIAPVVMPSAPAAPSVDVAGLVKWLEGQASMAFEDAEAFKLKATELRRLL